VIFKHESEIFHIVTCRNAENAVIPLEILSIGRKSSVNRCKFMIC